MSYGVSKVFPTTGIVSGASTLTSFLFPKAFTAVALEISTMSTAAAIDVYGSTDGATFRPVFERVNTATIQYATLTVSNAIGTGGGIMPLSNFNYPYMQLRCTAVVSGGVSITVIGMD